MFTIQWPAKDRSCSSIGFRHIYKMDHVQMFSQSGPACKPISQVQTHIECSSNDIINDKPPESKFVGKGRDDFYGFHNDLRGEEDGDTLSVDKLAEEFKKSVSSEHFSNGLINGVDNCRDSSTCNEEDNKDLSEAVEKGDGCHGCAKGGDNSVDIEYVAYQSELQMPDIMRLIQKDLSEPYSIYTYRYFIHNWPKLCFLAMHKGECVGAIVCKLDVHRKVAKRGYIAMLAVDEKYRKRSIGSNLVLKAIAAMVADDADEVVLETEITNQPALRLYENLGFVRDKRLFRYYLNGVDALRLKLWLR